MGSTKNRITPTVQRIGRSEPHRHKPQQPARDNQRRRKMREQDDLISQGKIPDKVDLFELDLHDCFELQMRIAALEIGNSTELPYELARLILQDLHDQITLSAPYGPVGLHALDGAFKMAVERVMKTDLLLDKNKQVVRRLQPMINQGRELAEQAINSAGRRVWRCDYTMEYEPQLELAS